MNDSPVWPAVSVVMPVLDESRDLRAAVHGVLAQDYPGELELVMALGPSKDGTDVIAGELVAADPRVWTIPNPSGRTPCALNAAIAASRFGIVIRADAHGVLPADYVRIVVELLKSTGAANVGGIMQARGTTSFEKAVACAMTSPLGVGNARFRIGGAAGPAETVYLGAFRRDMLEQLGGYNESFDRGQDWELNLRIRVAGGLVWFSPRLRVSYRPRSSVKELAGQYFHSGRWRRVLTRYYHRSVNLRYLTPPAVLLAILAGALVGLFVDSVGWLVPAGYACGLLLGAGYAGRKLEWSTLPWLPLVLAVMHLSWAVGFLVSPLWLVPAKYRKSGAGGFLTQHLAVVVRQPGGNSALNAEIPQVVDDLAELGYTIVTADDAAELARSIAAVSGPCRIVDERFIGHRHALRMAVLDSRYPAVHVPGVLRVDTAHRRLLVEIIREQVASGDPVDPDHLAVVMSNHIAVHQPKLGDLLATVPRSTAEHETAVIQLAAAGEDEPIRLRQAVKVRDVFTATFLVSPYSRYMARWCARRGLTPNQITFLSLAVALSGAAAAATGSRSGYILGAIALMGSFVLDCVDGQLARYTVQYSRVGAWLDLFVDRIKDYGFYAGLACGSAISGDSVWDLALVAMALQAVRNAAVDSYAQLRQTAGQAGQGGNVNPISRLSRRLNASRCTVYLRMALTLPIGDRWLLTAMLAAFATPRTVFAVLIAGSIFAIFYIMASRILRTLGQGNFGRLDEAEQLDRRRLAAIADSAALTFLLSRHRATGMASWSFSWLIPVLLRCLEYGTVSTLALSGHRVGAVAAFWYLACVILYQYNMVYQFKSFGYFFPRWPSLATGGSDGRTVLLLLLTLAGNDVLRIFFLYLTASLICLLVITVVQFWLHETSGRRHADWDRPVFARAVA